jgi:hypothetical protein
MKLISILKIIYKDFAICSQGPLSEVPRRPSGKTVRELRRGACGTSCSADDWGEFQNSARAIPFDVDASSDGAPSFVRLVAPVHLSFRSHAGWPGLC